MAQAPHEITINVDDLINCGPDLPRAEAGKVIAESRKAGINGKDTELTKTQSSLILKVPSGLPTGPWIIFLLDEYNILAGLEFDSDKWQLLGKREQEAKEKEEEKGKEKEEKKKK